MKFLIEADKYIYYEITDFDTLNDGRPILFFIPGGPGFSFENYSEKLKPLEKVAHIVYHDPRGCGKSSEFAEESYTLENNIKDIELLRNYLNFEKIAVMGISYGSMAALGYAVKHSTHISQLILAAGAVSHEFINLAKSNVKKSGSDLQVKICDELLWNGNFRDLNDLNQFMKIMFSLYSRRVATGVLENPFNIAKSICSVTPLNYAFSNNFFHFDYTEKLKEINCNTLVIWGAYDWINDPSFAQILKDKIPACELVMLPDSGHSMLTDAYDEFIAKVTDAIS